ncbi:MAG: hypothetical protein Greene07144_645 [Parcubacteria group bacterium Greene0714_4]|nr:MAG: hypothetical protein Greene07144_645 [Parcubacteria group bacterium Greene0714_4]
MLYLLYGADEKKAREKLSALISHLRIKKPDAEYVRITEEEYALPMVLECVLRQGLFEKKSIILLDRILQKRESREEIIEHLQEVADSDNVVIFFESVLDKKIVERMKQHGGKVQEFEDTSTSPRAKIPFNIFSIADAFGTKDTKRTWSLYVEALHKRVTSDEILAILNWQVKSMLIASMASNVEKSGLSPFVYKKSKAYAQKYGEEALKSMSRELLVMYHDMRRGTIDLETVLELRLLNL